MRAPALSQMRRPGAGNFAQSSFTSPATFAISASSVGFATTRSIHAASFSISVVPMPRDVTAGVPRRMPDGSNGFRGSNGTEL